MQNAPGPRSVGSTTSYSSILGQMIAQARNERSLSQEQLASSLGITQTAWSRIERGVTSITAEQLRRVANVLQCKPYEIVHKADEAVEKATDSGWEIVAPRDYDTLIKNGVIILTGATLAAALLHLYMKSRSQ